MLACLSSVDRLADEATAAECRVLIRAREYGSSSRPRRRIVRARGQSASPPQQSEGDQSGVGIEPCILTDSERIENKIQDKRFKEPLVYQPETYAIALFFMVV
ncbi:MAG: hypothetical protein ACYCRE_05340, partial [Acidobacteriaceae bacterium]